MARFIEAMSHIDIIYIIDKRWQWLGHVLRMKHDRNIHKALNLFPSTPSAIVLLYLHRAIELASNIQHWNESFDQNVDFISLKTCFDHGKCRFCFLKACYAPCGTNKQTDRQTYKLHNTERDSVIEEAHLSGVIASSISAWP